MKSYTILSTILTTAAISTTDAQDIVKSSLHEQFATAQTGKDLRGTNKTLAPTSGVPRPPPTPAPITPFPTEEEPKTKQPYLSMDYNYISKYSS